MVRFVFLFWGTSSALSQNASYRFDVPIVWDEVFFFRPKAWYKRFEVEPLDKCSWKRDPCLALHILIQYSQLRMVSEDKGDGARSKNQQAGPSELCRSTTPAHHRLLTTEPNHSERFSEEGRKKTLSILGHAPYAVPQRGHRL